MSFNKTATAFQKRSQRVHAFPMFPSFDTPEILFPASIFVESLSMRAVAKILRAREANTIRAKAKF